MNEESGKVHSEQLTQQRNIVFFDGVCSLCTGFIDFLISRDKRQKFFYASLQGNAAKLQFSDRALKSLNDQNFTTLYYSKNGKIHSRSTAVLKILADLGGVWKLTICFLLVPRFMRDAIYDVVAAHRYRWFGKRETCRAPTKEERNFFLD